MKELVKADKCKREIILDYFGYEPSKRIGPEHTCCDFHQQKCCCDDCILNSAVQMMGITSPAANDSSNDEINLSNPVEENVLPRPFTTEQKDLLRTYLLNYRQFLHGYGKSCVGSVGLSTGFSLELIDTIVEYSSELTTLDEVKLKLPLFDSSHACAIFEILQSVKST